LVGYPHRENLQRVRLKGRLARRQKVKVVEIFRSIQGEGINQGRLAVFVRFSGCNLKCPWCDTPQGHTDSNLLYDFSEDELMAGIDKLAGGHTNLVVLTGGEPLDQDHGVLHSLLSTLFIKGYRVQIETNGTIPFFRSAGNHLYITTSPKPPRYDLKVRPDEVKLVVTEDFDPELLRRFEPLELNGVALVLQPEWNAREVTYPKAVQLVRENPKWILRLQMHKLLEMR
jgi:7-carboxy-7-deazaguanine synthase